jgi:DMSO/TMAO reductase YedYZ molybdopterin-dependent catalytic subunit
MTRAVCLLLFVLLTPWVSHAQTVALVVDGDVRNKLSLSLDDLRAMNHQRIEVEDRGARVLYAGVPLTEILRRAGLDIGRAPLQGRALASVLFVTAADGFQAIFALPELDAASPDRRILLADARDGQALSDNEGPLRIVAPADKYPARWVRNVVRLTVVQVSASSQR